MYPWAALELARYWTVWSKVQYPNVLNLLLIILVADLLNQRLF